MSQGIHTYVPPRSQLRSLALTAAAGGVLFLLGLTFDPRRAWTGYLMGFTYFVGLCLAGGLFLSVLTLASARWATALRRIPEAMTAGLFPALVLGLVLMGGVTTLYEWSHGSVVEGDPLLADKAVYLNGASFFVRLVVYFVLWIGLTRGMLGVSRDEHELGATEARRRRFKYAALFLPVFAVTFSLASVDWIQSLEPHWFSTIFALVTLSSVGTSGLAVCVLLALYLRRYGALRGVLRDDHLDDLGKIGIGLALFWGYIWFCQYMLIWYTNMPEETPYYALRLEGPWRALTWANVGLNWAVPFFVLMPRAARRSGAVLARVAVVMLVGQALNLYIQIGPPLVGPEPVFGVWELAPLFGALALFSWCTLRALGRGPVVPAGSVELEECLRHHF